MRWWSIYNPHRLDKPLQREETVRDTRRGIKVSKTFQQLGIEITRDAEARSISLNQHSYLDSILQRCNMEHCKAVSMPMDPSLVLTRDQCPSPDSDEFREMKQLLGVPTNDGPRTAGFMNRGHNRMKCSYGCLVCVCKILDHDFS